jgi:hypothetical protein
MTLVFLICYNDLETFNRGLTFNLMNKYTINNTLKTNIIDHLNEFSGESGERK